MKRIAGVVITWLAVVSAVAAQELRFEVASLKRNSSGSSSTSMSDRPDGLVMENGTLRNLLFNAFRPQSTELVGAPGWLADRYNLVAKAAGPTTAEQRAAMLRALLAERLHLQAHYEMREQPVFELVFANRDRSLGPNLVPTDRDCAAPTLFTALQEQLGLKLEPSRAPLQTLVIDRVERPTEQ